MGVYSRRQVFGAGLGGAVALASLSACGRKTKAAQEGTLDWAVSGSWRNGTDKARDKFRHPVELLTFSASRRKTRSSTCGLAPVT